MAEKPTYEQLIERSQELTKEKEFLEAALNAQTDTLFVFEPSTGKAIRWNKAFRKLSGYSDDEIRSLKAPDSYYDDEDLKKAAIATEKIVDEGTTTIELSLITKNGQKVPTEYTASLIRDRQGKPKYFIAVGRDITGRKLVEETLRASEERFSLFMDHLPSIAFIKDSESRTLYVNKNMNDILGARDWIGKTPLEVFPKDTAEHMVADDKKALSDGYRLIIEKVPDKNGVEHIYQTHKFRIDRDGEPPLLGGIALDITEHEKAEQALRESESKLRTLFDLSPQAIALSDFKTGKLLDINTKFSELTKYKAEEIIGRTTVECGFFSKVDRARFTEEFQGSGEVRGLEMNFKAKDGSVLNALVFSKVIQIGHEDLLINMFLDMTEQRRLEVQLQQSQKMEALGTLAGGIAHDFNNILSVIQGRVSLMLFDTDPTPSNYEHLKTIEKQVQSGARLTRQMLGYARKGRYHLKPISLNQLVEETSRTFGRTRKEIVVLTELTEGPCPVEADQGQIEQVLLNLYVNAADAMPRGGELTIETAYVTDEHITNQAYQPTSGKYVLLTVKDTGLGMNKETQERIFDPFFTTKEMGQGTGLGLASTYGIVKNHGGYIDVHSKKGVGTTFSIYLPASEKLIEKQPVTEPRLRPEHGTILMVDDEDLVLGTGVAVLERLGYMVLQATSGKKAIEIFETKNDEIDLVILDMIMPGISGGQAYDRMKEIKPNVRVLLSSGYSLDSEAKEILARGCDGFIQKPFSIEELSRAIWEILESG